MEWVAVGAREHLRVSRRKSACEPCMLLVQLGQEHLLREARWQRRFWRAAWTEGLVAFFGLLEDFSSATSRTIDGETEVSEDPHARVVARRHRSREILVAHVGDEFTEPSERAFMNAEFKIKHARRVGPPAAMCRREARLRRRHGPEGFGDNDHMSLRATVTDDRGRRVPLAAMDLSTTGRAAGAGMTPLLDHPSDRNAPPQEDRRQAMRFALAAVPVLAATTVIPFVLIVFKLISPWTLVPVMLVLGLIEGGIFVLLLRRMHARRAARLIVGSGRCGSCNYTLQGLVAESDGCRVCPECGAAWR